MRQEGQEAWDRPDRPTPVPWPDVPVVDIHGHIGTFQGYDLAQETLLANLGRHPIALLLVSNLDGAAVPGRTRDLGEDEANRQTLALVRNHPHRIRGLLWGRPGDGRVGVLRSLLAERVEGGGWTERAFVGLKLHPEMNGFPADDPRLDPYLELCGEADLPVVIHSDGVVDDASPDRIRALARRHPEVPIVLYHMGFQGPHEPAIRVAEDALRAEGEGDLLLETAQAAPDAVVDAVERLGAGRVLFGSDATYYGARHYEAYGPLVRRLREALDPRAVHRVFHANAVELFRLEDRSPGP